MNGWTEERKRRQRELIQRWRPWEQSTGPKTPEGKARASHNSTKTGGSKQLREMIKELNKVLRKQRELI